MQAIILAGGKPTQLHSPTTDCPKPMVPLFDRPVMEHTIELLARHGITDIVVAASHLARGIMDYFGDGSPWSVQMRYSIESEPLGTAGAVKQARNMIDGRFIVMSGDIVTDFDLISAIERHADSGSIATILLGEADEPTQFGIVQQDESGRVTRILEKPKSDEAFSSTVSTGIYICEPELISCIPYDQSCDFARQIFPAMLANREPILGFSPAGYWCDVGNLNHYRSLHFDAIMGRLNLDLAATHIGEGIWIGERVVIDPSVELAAPVYIGAGATIRRGARLGERAVIGSGAVVDEYASVTHSVIGCKSFVGRNSHISNCIIGGGYSVNEWDSLADRTLVSHISYELPVTRTSPTVPIAKPKKQAAKT